MNKMRVSKALKTSKSAKEIEEQIATFNQSNKQTRDIMGMA